MDKNSSKTLRFVIGALWLIVAIVLFTRNQTGAAVFTIAIALLFFYFGYKSDSQPKNPPRR